jgi:primosomal protein N' (replication factor Y)
LLTTLLRGGYDAAAALQLGERLASGLPPFAHLALLRAECRQREVLDGFMDAARDAIFHLLPRKGDAARRARSADAKHREDVVTQDDSSGNARIRISGPFAAPMPLRAGRHRMQLLLESAQRAPLRQVLATWLPQLYALPQPRGLRWSIDVDPVDLY